MVTLFVLNWFQVAMIGFFHAPASLDTIRESSNYIQNQVDFFEILFFVFFQPGNSHNHKKKEVSIFAGIITFKTRDFTKTPHNIHIMTDSSSKIWTEAESISTYKARATKYQSLVQNAIKNNLLSDEQPVIDVFDFDEFDARIQDLLKAFPEEEITHGLAVKSQPLSGILKFAIEKYPRLGAECRGVAR